MVTERLKKIKLVAILIAIGTITIAVATFYEAIQSLASPFTKDSGRIIIDFRLASYDDKDVQKQINPNSDFRYVENSSGHIEATSKYISGFYKDNTILIPQLGYYEPPSFESLHFPIFDLKLINNTKETIVLDKLIFEVESSEIDERPLIYLYTAVYQEDKLCLSMINEGWKEWKSCSLYFNFFPLNSVPNKRASENDHFAHSATIPFFENKHNLDLTSYLESEGVDVAFLRDHFNEGEYVTTESNDIYLRALSRFSDYRNWFGEYEAGIDGIIVITDHNNKLYRLSIRGRVVLLTIPGLGGGLETYDHYEVKLRTQGKNYIINHPVSISLTPNEPLRMFLTIAADKSSMHRFKVKLNNINNIDVYSNPVDLHILLPKSSYFEFNRRY